MMSILTNSVISYVAAHTAGRTVHKLCDPYDAIRSVSIENVSPGHCGEIDIDERWDDKAFEDLFVCYLVAELDLNDLISGIVAEKYARLRDWDAVVQEGLKPLDESIADQAERATAQGWIGWLHEDHPDKTEQEIWSLFWLAGVEWVEANWPNIADLADDLMEQGHIAGKQLYRWWHKRPAVAAFANP